MNDSSARLPLGTTTPPPFEDGQDAMIVVARATTASFKLQLSRCKIRIQSTVVEQIDAMIS